MEANPGARFHEVKRDLGIPHGVLLHHLRVLRQQGLLVLEHEGRRLRLRLPGQRFAPAPDPNAVPLADLIRVRPGITIGEASELLEWTRRATSYRAENLVRRGLARWIPDGPRRRLVVVGPAPEGRLVPSAS